MSVSQNLRRDSARKAREKLIPADV